MRSFAARIAGSLLVVGCCSGPAVAEDGVSFELDVMPILTARGCNAGACHGKQRGQNGFQLSLLGFDPDFDFESLTRLARGRRVFPAAPQRSLLLLKATGRRPHGGGIRVEADSDDYRELLSWITAGAARRLPAEPKLTGISVSPAELSLQPRQAAELQVIAQYSDGATRDVTGRTTFQSNDPAIAAVDPAGRIQAGPLPGETAVMSRYMNHIAVTQAAIPLPGETPEGLYDRLPVNNFIDRLVWDKLESLGVTPSAPIDDAKYMRRVYLDVIGRLPTADEARRFLGDDSPTRRGELVDRLLQRPEYADHWAGKWADLLRPNPYRVGIKATLNYDNWIREQFRRNRPYDEFVRELVAAQGSTWRNGAAVLFRDRRSPDEVTTLISQLFLGVRLECAKCHHHPFEKWGQDDFYGMAAYFARVGRKGRGLSPPISGDEEIVFASSKGEVRHPLTGEVTPPAPLYGSTPDADTLDDPREALAAWITAEDNEYFAKSRSIACGPT